MNDAEKKDGSRSIGEILDDLRGDFPDISVSKIRFLESQGLITPERSPSGYRQFTESDLELLRWILRLQRDHYLPLKVIRRRLKEGDGPGSEIDVSAPGAEEPEGYGPEALRIAQACAGFFAYGVEARHLKMYKRFAEQEAAILQQVVPHASAKDPGGAAKAADAMCDLASLGAALRLSMLRVGLGPPPGA